MQDECGFLFGLREFTRRKEKPRTIQTRIKSARIKVDGVLQRRISLLPLMLREFGLCQLIGSLRIARIKLQGVLKLDGGFLVLILLHVPLSALQLLDLPLLGLSCAAAQTGLAQKN